MDGKDGMGSGSLGRRCALTCFPHSLFLTAYWNRWDPSFSIDPPKVQIRSDLRGEISSRPRSAREGRRALPPTQERVRRCPQRSCRQRARARVPQAERGSTVIVYSRIGAPGLRGIPRIWVRHVTGAWLAFASSIGFAVSRAGACLFGLL